MGAPVPDDQNSHDSGSRSGSDRPDWLVGADEGVEAEKARITRPAGPPPPLRLIRPTQEEPVRPAPPAPLPTPTLSKPEAEARPLEFTMDPAGNSGAGGMEAPRIVAGQKAPDAKSAKPVAWTAAASSVPALRAAAASPPAPFSVVAGGRPSGPAAQAPPAAARSSSAPQLEPRWEQGAASDASQEEGELEFPDDSTEPVLQNRPAAVRVAIARPRESWWAVALDAIRSDWRIHIALGLLVAAIATYCVWPRAEKSSSLATIRHHPERFDGARVFVRGRVGEVFSLGGGYSFYLHQGRDTMVVFTRGAMPQTHKEISVKGTIQTGFLDGIPRQALFADPE